MEQNKTGKYLKYAIGEIILVMIGILLALQVNNWNEERKRQVRFNFGVKELYNQIRRDYLYDNNIEDKAAFQIALMERILKGDSIFNPKHIPGLVQIFDDNFESDAFSMDFLESFLEFNPNNEEQNELAKSVRKYSSDRYSLNNIARLTTNYNTLTSHLKVWKIPLRERGRVNTYNDFSENIPDGFYSENNLLNALDMIKDESFITDLKSLLEWKKATLAGISDVQELGIAQMVDLKNYYSKIDFRIPKIEIIGNATVHGNWGKGIPMQNTSEDDSIWEVTIELMDGLIKFRTDGGWTFDWGRAQTDNNKLVFKGSDIEVKGGHYRIILDIKESTYKLIPIAK